MEKGGHFLIFVHLQLSFEPDPKRTELTTSMLRYHMCVHRHCALQSFFSLFL